MPDNFMITPDVLKRLWKSSLRPADFFVAIVPYKAEHIPSSYLSCKANGL